MIFLDTSIYIAASLARHERHAACFELLSDTISKRRKMGCGAHSMAELYSVLTRMPRPDRVSPTDAIAIVDRIESLTTLVSLSSAEQMVVVRDCAARRLVSGIVHDAGLVACAQKAKATAIYTLNVRHFRLAAPDLSSIILEPTP